MSQAVKKLEMKPGIGLLNQITRQFSLTEEGERYFRRVQSISQEMTATESEAMETRNTSRGLLWIDVATPVVLHSLMSLTKPFRRRYLEVILPLVSSETIIDLIERKVGATTRIDTLTDSSLRTRPLFNGYRKIIAPPDYISCYGRSETIDDLKQHIYLRFTEPASLNTWPIACSDG